MSPDDLPERIVSEFASDPDLGELVRLYVDEMPQRIAALEAQFAAANWVSLGNLAHQIKGAAGSYGFGLLSTMAAQLEIACRQTGTNEAIREAFEGLIESLRRAVADS